LIYNLVSCFKYQSAKCRFSQKPLYYDHANNIVVMNKKFVGQETDRSE